MRFLRALSILILLAFAPLSASMASVNINTATVEELAEGIKGVGINKAKAIVQYRDEHGAFKSVDQLTQIKGIGDKTVERNRDNMSVTDTK